MNSININYWDEVPDNYTGHIKHRIGSQGWYKNGKLHREDGPAYIGADGRQEWFLNDRLHREGGPAITWSDGTQKWYLNGKYYTKEDYYKELHKRGLITEAELFIELL